MAAQGTYLYCFARAGAVQGLDVPGIDGRRAVAPLERGGVAARFAGQEEDGLRPAFQLALLVGRRQLPAFRDRTAAFAEAHRGTGLVVESTGPWPPYHFCPTIGRADA